LGQALAQDVIADFDVQEALFYVEVNGVAVADCGYGTI
jgi:hypothetical protein